LEQPNSPGFCYHAFSPYKSDFPLATSSLFINKFYLFSGKAPRQKDLHYAMKLTTRARYALRAMIKIAQDSEQDRPLKLSDVAERTSVSRRYLEQLVIPLKNASLIRGLSGKEGGYTLARSAEDIKVGEIIQASIGPINIVDCVNDPDSCMKVEWCECRPLYVLLNRKITDALNEFSLADLAEHKVEQEVSRQLGTAFPDISHSCSEKKSGKRRYSDDSTNTPNRNGL